MKCGLLVSISVVILSACSDAPSPDEDGAVGPVLSKVSKEPPGAHCPAGGTSVLSGIDRDADGVLGAHEVDTTVYVCERDQVRLVDEPAGANCPDGGTAVWVGDDADGDGALEQGEVRDVMYLCKTVHALVKLVTLDAPGAPCVHGAAIQVGHDLDDDGELDPAEVLLTEYVCGAAYAGYLAINDLTDLDYYRNVRVVASDLSISWGRLGQVELPNLSFVGGDVTILDNATLTSVRLPSLYSVGKSLTVANNPLLTQLGVPSLEEIGRVTVFGNGQLAGLDLGDSDIFGSVTVGNNAMLAEIDWTNGYVEGPIEVYGNPVLASATIVSTSGMAGHVIVRDNPQLGALTLRASNVRSSVLVTRNATLSTLALEVGDIWSNLSIIDNPKLTQVNPAATYSSIRHVGGDLEITGSPISNLKLGSGFTGLYVDGDAVLGDLQVATLRNHQRGIEIVSGTLTLYNNPLLTSLRLRGGRGISVVSNAALQSAEIEYSLWYEDGYGVGHATSLKVLTNPVLQSFQAYNVSSIAEVWIAYNPVLASPGLRIGSASSIRIIDNASMPVCSIEALFARVAAQTEIQSGNDEAGVCN